MDEKELKHIIKLCKKGKEQGFKSIYKLFGPVLLGVACRYAKDKQEAEDILQESLIKVFKKINSYQGKGSFEGWMKRIVVNTSLNKIKKNSSLKEDELPDYGLKIDGVPSANIDGEYLILCLNKLPAGYRTVFNMFVIDGYSHKEIAKELGISEGTSKSQYSKARSALKNLINMNELIL